MRISCKESSDREAATRPSGQVYTKQNKTTETRRLTSHSSMDRDATAILSSTKIPPAPSPNKWTLQTILTIGAAAVAIILAIVAISIKGAKGEKGDKGDTGTDTGYIRTVTAINVGVNPNPFLGATQIGSMLIPDVVATAQTKWSVRPDWALSIIDNNMELFLSDVDGAARFTTTDAKALRLKGIGGLKYQLFSDAKRYAKNSPGLMIVGVDGVPLILQIDPPIQ